MSQRKERTEQPVLKNLSFQKFLYFLANSLIKMPADPKRGAKIFKTKCTQCHSVKKGQNGQGPSMYGIVGRKSGQVEGFNYTAANKNSGLVWNKKTLSKYLTNPKKMIPGTKMIFAGIKKKKDRSDLIAFLAQHHD